jgi:hypothetical protein
MTTYFYYCGMFSVDTVPSETPAVLDVADVVRKHPRQ